MVESSGCLVLWCAEFFEHPLSPEGLSLMSRKFSQYDGHRLYAPSNSSDLSGAYDAAFLQLIANGNGPQDSHWQIARIVSYMHQNKLSSAEVIGELPGCIDIVGKSLHQQGLVARVIHTNGTVNVYQ